MACPGSKLWPLGLWSHGSGFRLPRDQTVQRQLAEGSRTCSPWRQSYLPQDVTEWAPTGSGLWAPASFTWKNALKFGPRHVKASVVLPVL